VGDGEGLGDRLGLPGAVEGACGAVDRADGEGEALAVPVAVGVAVDEEVEEAVGVADFEREAEGSAVAGSVEIATAVTPGDAEDVPPPAPPTDPT
jgi:hypothetical protein